MIALYLSPLYICVCGYLFWRFVRWLSAGHSCFEKKSVRVILAIVYLGVIFSILIAFLMEPSTLQRKIQLFANYWLGVLLYTVLVVAAADIMRLIIKKTNLKVKDKLFSRTGHLAVGTICLILTAAFSITGILSARTIKMTDYQIAVDKKAGYQESLKVILIADLHLGYSIGNWHMEQMVHKINQEAADLVVIAGDIFDNEYAALEHPGQIAETLSHIKSKYGVYACYGNHDIEEKILAGFTFSSDKKKVSDPRMDEFLEKAEIKLLRDEGVLIDDAFYLYGRPDYERPGRGIEARKTPGQITKDMDLAKPVLVIDHEPRELEELSNAGVDVDLCGHTHDGQTFPGNLTIHLFWENPCGYLKKGDMHNIVTSGIGVFGPNMRVGTRSEICRINVEFL